jgi:hypothetical protein
VPVLAIAARRSSGPLVVRYGYRLLFADHRFALAIAVTVCEFATDPAAGSGDLVRIRCPRTRHARPTAHPVYSQDPAVGHPHRPGSYALDDRLVVGDQDDGGAVE